MYGIYQMMYLFVDTLELTIEMYTKYSTESIVINHRASKAKLAVEVHELQKDICQKLSNFSVKFCAPMILVLSLVCNMQWKTICRHRGYKLNFFEKE